MSVTLRIEKHPAGDVRVKTLTSRRKAGGQDDAQPQEIR
jgi:hypothetical protein